MLYIFLLSVLNRVNCLNIIYVTESHLRAHMHAQAGIVFVMCNIETSRMYF
jgi:hypothetical protein